MSRTENRRPRVGISFRTYAEERAGRGPDRYAQAVTVAGGEPVMISLGLSPERLLELARVLDALILPGAPADVDPRWYHAERHERCGVTDPRREQADFALLDVAVAEGKPVLGICYGVQSLNVYLGGTLIQDITSEVDTEIRHEREKDAPGTPDPQHDIRLLEDTRLARLAGTERVRVNSSHHQAILRPGRDLRVAATAPDGIIEAVEWTGNSGWITGVQWHPERTPDDALSAALFRELVTAALVRQN
jgi:putative glutamine amidotransferase